LLKDCGTLLTLDPPSEMIDKRINVTLKRGMYVNKDENDYGIHGPHHNRERLIDDDLSKLYL